MNIKPSVIASVVALSLSATAAADLIQLIPTKDNSLIQQSNPTSQLSNGLGDIFVGRTNQDGQGPATISIRRGLLAFDIAGNIPAGSIISAVSLTMRDVMGLNGDPAVGLRRVLQDWGEGTSFQNGGAGAAATDGDATWLYRSFNASNPAASIPWINEGGDFSTTVSGSTIVSDDLGGNQFFTWSSATNPQMIADVQDWLENPTNNFGWAMLGDESRGQSAKRLNSGESAVPPLLQVTFTAIPEPLALPFLLAAGGTSWIVRVRRRRKALAPT